MKPRLGHSRLHEIIELAYAASEDRSLWERVLGSIVEATGATAGAVLSHDLVSTGSVLVQQRLDPESTALYAAHYHRVDAWALAVAARGWPLGFGAATPGESLVEPSAFGRTEFGAFVQHFRISRLLRTAFDGPGGSNGLSLYRTEGDPPFGATEGRFVEALAPHLCRSLRVHGLLGRATEARDAALDAVDAVGHGVMLVGRDCRLMYANREAERILAARDGLLTDRALLTATTPAATSSLRRLVAGCGAATREAIGGAGGAMNVQRPSGRRPLQLLVCPTRRSRPLGFPHEGVFAVVFVSDPSRHPAPDRELLSAYYGFSQTEADVAVRLAAGESLEEIAEARRYTLETVRWYVKQLLNKAGCRTRASLVREIVGRLGSLSTR